MVHDKSAPYKNPFANYGSIAEGDRFIGRRGSMQVVESRVIIPPEPGNLAIIGLPRIGKSSLAHKAIMERKQELLTRKFLPIWIDPGSGESSHDSPPLRSLAFFHALVKQCVDELQTLGWLTTQLQYTAKRALQDEGPSSSPGRGTHKGSVPAPHDPRPYGWSEGEGYRRIQRFFEKVRQAGVRVIFILDDFDSVSQLFKEDTSGFQKLAELSDRPAWRVTFVTTSRRTIHEIELQTQATPSSSPGRGTRKGAPLHRLFHEHFLTMFDEADHQEYFARLAMVGISVTEALKEATDFYCGGHPYLLEILGYELVKLFHASPAGEDIDAAARNAEPAFERYYDQLLGMLREDGMLDEFLQTLFVLDKSGGPDKSASYRPTARDEMLRYGLIKAAQQDASITYSAFSNRFQAFLRRLEEVTPDPLGAINLEGTINWPPTEQETLPLSATGLWALWRETEKTLRAALTSILQKKYGDDWFEKLEIAHPKSGEKDGKDVFQRCRESRKRDETNWESKTFRSMLDFSAPQDLFMLASAEWDLFEPVFGHDQNYWQRRNQLLGTVRVLLAHNREEAIYDHERRRAVAYCREMLTTLQKWRDLGKTREDTINRPHRPMNWPSTTVGEPKTDLWALWQEVERALRTVIASVLKNEYGENWFDQVEAAQPNLVERDGKNMFQRCREVHQKEVQIGGSRVVHSLLDFAYAQELFAVVFAEWWLFQPIFGQNWFYWQERAQKFAMMRNPLAHNREEAIQGEKRIMAENYCREILAALRTYSDKF